MSYNKEKCDEWDRQRISRSPVNPFTKRQIKKDGLTYKKIDLICRKSDSKRKEEVVDIDKICMKWLENKYPNLGKPHVNVEKHVSRRLETNPDLLSNRQKLAVILTNFLRKSVNDNKILPGNVCMSNSQTLLKVFTNVKRIEDTTVYIGDINIDDTPHPFSKSHSIAIKEKDLPEDFVPSTSKFPFEYLFNELINKILDSGVCPSFNYTFCIFFCDHCLPFVRIFADEEASCSVTMLEKFDSVFESVYDSETQWVILFQLLTALHCIHSLYGLCHKDIKYENVFLKNINPAPNTYWKYVVDGINYFVPNTGVISCLGGFGKSFSYSPKLSNDDLGLRFAEVVGSSFVPFTTTRFPKILANGKIRAAKPKQTYNNKNRTINQFWKGFNSGSSIPVDLDNFQRFPTAAMCDDIQQLLYMFLGGRTVNHVLREEIEHLSSGLKKELKKLEFIRFPDSEDWKTQQPYMFLANKLIHKLFKKFTVLPSNATIIETYHLPN